MAKVFISYVKEDIEPVSFVTRNLQRNGVGVWRDKEELSGGSRWKAAIRSAIQDGTFFVSVHSKNRQMRDATYANEELAVAIEELRKKPYDKIWLIPVTLDGTMPEDRPIGGGETLRDLHVENLTNLKNGTLQLLKCLGIEEAALAEAKKPKGERGEFVAPQGSPFSAIEALETMSLLEVDDWVSSEWFKISFGRLTLSDLSSLGLITMVPTGRWKLTEPVKDPLVSLSVALAKIPAFQVAVGELQKDIRVSGKILGERISEFLGRDWSEASCVRNGQAYKKWTAVMYPNFRLPRSGEKNYLYAQSISRKSLKKGRGSQLSPEVLLKIGRLKRRGLNYNEIAKEIGVPKQTLSNWRRDDPKRWDKL